MKLRSSPSSPFVARLKWQLIFSVFPTRLAGADRHDGSQLFCEVNPRKIPTLEDGGNTYYDSRVIMEYLDAKLVEAKLSRPAVRSALCVNPRGFDDGILDAAVLIVYESRMRPDDKYVESVVERQRGKISRGLAVIAAATIKMGRCRMLVKSDYVLDYLDFRKQVNWRDHAPGLEKWLADFAAAVPGFAESAPGSRLIPAIQLRSICREHTVQLQTSRHWP